MWRNCSRFRVSDESLPFLSFLRRSRVRRWMKTCRTLTQRFFRGWTFTTWSVTPFYACSDKFWQTWTFTTSFLSLCWYHWWNFALTTFFVIILIMFAKIYFGVSGARVWNGSRGISPGNIGPGWRHPCWTQRQWQLELWTFFGSKFNIFHWSPAVVCIFAYAHQVDKAI